MKGMKGKGRMMEKGNWIEWDSIFKQKKVCTVRKDKGLQLATKMEKLFESCLKNFSLTKCY